MEKYGQETKTLLEIFAWVLVMHPTGFCLMRSKYHLTIKKPCVYTFLWSPRFRRFGCLATKEYTVIQVCQKHKFHQYGFSSICMVAIITENPHCLYISVC